MAKVLITARKGYPCAIISDVNWSSFRCHSNRRTSVKILNDGTLSVSADYWYQFVEINKENLGLKYVDDIEVDENSQPYYGFYIGDKLFCRSHLTPKFVDMFFNYDCNRMIRFEPNTTDNRNCLGMRLTEFSTTIFENAYSPSVDEDTTVEECLALRNGCHPESSAYKVLTAHIETLQDKNLNVEDLKETIRVYETTLNSVFEQFKTEIEGYILTLPEKPFDCGWTIVETIDEKMKSCYQKLKSLGKRDSINVDVQFPSNYFSCSQSHLILKKLRELSQDPILNTISIRTILD